MKKERLPVYIIETSWSSFEHPDLTLYRNVAHTEMIPGQPYLFPGNNWRVGGSDALLIKLSGAAVFDPQYAIVVSSKLPEKCSVGAALRERRENILTFVKRSSLNDL